MTLFPPVFVGGVGRSGTTLGVDMLGLHPLITPIYETHFVLELFELLLSNNSATSVQAKSERIRTIMNSWSKTLPYRPDSKRAHELYHHGAHHILFTRNDTLEETSRLVLDLQTVDSATALRAFVLRLFEKQCVISGKPAWINKTPAYVSRLPLLHSVFPDMRFIHCIRDGRDVVLSVLTRPWGPNTVKGAALWWSSTVEAAAAFGQENPSVYIEIRYEDIVLKTHETLSKLFKWLGMRDESDRIVERHYGAESPIDLSRQRVGRWKTEATPDQISTIERFAGKQLEHFGYMEL